MHHLRLYQPESEAIRLAEVYEKYALIRERSHRTARLDAATLKYWREATGDPPLEMISDETLAQFKHFLERKQLSRATIAKHLRHLQSWIDFSGPRTRQNRNALGLLRDVPFIPKPTYSPVIRPRLSLQDLSELVEKSSQANDSIYTSPVPSRLWWPLLVGFLWNTALRVETALLIEWKHIEGNYIVIPAKAMKRRERGHTLYANSICRRIFEMLKPYGAERLFPFRNWPQSERYFHKLRRRLWNGVGAHAIRRSVLTIVASQSTVVARQIAAHTSRDTLADYYVGPEAQVPILEALTQPQKLLSLLY